MFVYDSHDSHKQQPLSLNTLLMDMACALCEVPN
jgi:hypothetical protein